ncbi:protein TolA, partial [Acinetobacter sp. TY2]
MKKIEQPQSKQKAIALGFTVGVHVVAIVGLLFLGLSKPPEPPKQIKTILIKPEDLPPPEPKPLIKSDSTETADNHVAETIQQTAEPTPDAPDIPTTQPDQAQADLQKATNDAQAAAAAQLAALAATKAKNEAAEAARQKAAAAEKARLDAADKLKQAKNAAEKSKAEAEMKVATEKAAKEKANQVTKDAQAKAARDAQAAKDAQAKATRDAQAAKDKAAKDAQAKATRDAQ